MPQKSSGAGVEWYVHPAALLGELDNEVNVRNQLKIRLDEFEQDNPDLLNEVRVAIDTWYGLYHIIVLLVATIDVLASDKDVNRKEPMAHTRPSNPDQYYLEKCHIVSAYTQDEEYEGSDFPKYGTFIENELNGGFLNRSVGIGGQGDQFVAENINVLPHFQFFFGKLKPFLERFPSEVFTPTSSWSHGEYLDSFLKAVSKLRAANKEVQYETYVDRLRDLLEALWEGANIKQHLYTMHRWLDSGQEVGSEAWWIDTLNLNPIEDNITQLYKSDDEETIEETHKIAAIAYINSVIFKFIEIRFEQPDDEDTSHGLIGAIQRYSDKNSLKENPLGQMWDDILPIICGTIAWRIYRQASFTAMAMTNLLRS